MEALKHSLFRLGGMVYRALKKLDTRNDLELYREMYAMDAIKSHRFFNIGAGTFRHPAWTNLDIIQKDERSKPDDSLPFVHFNLFDHRPLPAEDGSLEVIYTSHTIEHVDDKSVQWLFSEVFRTLRPGGILRIVTPDILLAYRAWKRNDRRFFFWLFLDQYTGNPEQQGLNIPINKASIHQVFLEDFASQASEISIAGAPERISDSRLIEIFDTMPLDDALNYCTSFCSVEIQQQYPFHHINWFHEGKLKNMLEKAGFIDIYHSGYLQSSAPVMRNPKYFDHTLPQLSLYMEAIR